MQKVKRAAERQRLGRVAPKEDDNDGRQHPRVVPAGAITQTVLSKFISDSEPNEIICHGAVFEVPLGGSSDPPEHRKRIRAALPLHKACDGRHREQVRHGDQVDQVEMMLQDVDSQKGTLGGVLDYPGAVHALSFQGVPGESRFFARLDIHPLEPRLPRKLLPSTSLIRHLTRAGLAPATGQS